MVEKIFAKLGNSQGCFYANDNQFETIYVNDPKYHGRIKYLDNKNNFIRDIIARRENDPEMVVDPFTKSIIRNMFSVHVKSLGL